MRPSGIPTNSTPVLLVVVIIIIEISLLVYFFLPRLCYFCGDRALPCTFEHWHFVPLWCGGIPARSSVAGSPPSSSRCGCFGSSPCAPISSATSRTQSPGSCCCCRHWARGCVHAALQPALHQFMPAIRMPFAFVSIFPKEVFLIKILFPNSNVVQLLFPGGQVFCSIFISGCRNDLVLKM